MIPTFDLEKKDELKGSIFVSEEFLFLLFIIAFGDSGHEVRVVIGCEGVSDSVVEGHEVSVFVVSGVVAVVEGHGVRIVVE